MRTERPGKHRRRGGIVAASAGLLVAGAGVIGWALTDQVGTPPAPPAAAATSQASPSATSTTSPPTAPSPSTTTRRPSTRTTPAIPTTKIPTTTLPTTPSTASSTTPTPRPSAKTAPTAPSPPQATPAPSTASTATQPLSQSRPTAVRLPSIDVSSPVHGLGLNAQGGLTVPSGDRYDEVAWYDGSPTPGQVGPAILEGHVTGSGESPSVFFELGATKAGDEIEVDRADGTTATFTVTDVRRYPKADFPQLAVYGATPGPELRVITCGGSYDAGARRHVDNVVVFAKLARG